MKCEETYRSSIYALVLDECLGVARVVVNLLYGSKPVELSLQHAEQGTACVQAENWGEVLKALKPFDVSGTFTMDATSNRAEFYLLLIRKLNHEYPEIPM